MESVAVTEIVGRILRLPLERQATALACLEQHIAAAIALSLNNRASESFPANRPREP